MQPPGNGPPGGEREDLAKIIHAESIAYFQRQRAKRVPISKEDVFDLAQESAFDFFGYVDRTPGLAPHGPRASWPWHRYYPLLRNPRGIWRCNLYDHWRIVIRYEKFIRTLKSSKVGASDQPSRWDKLDLDDLRVAVSGLSVDIQKPLHLYFQGKRVVELARTYKMSRAAMYRLLEEGVDRLKQMFDVDA